MTTSAAHEPAQCRRVGGAELRYHTKNWSDAFRCPVCERQRRYCLNYLGRQFVWCDGVVFATSKIPGARPLGATQSAQEA